MIQDAAERETLLNTAEEELIRAQEIAPLNTDHTANLARLYARWASTTSSTERTTLIANAEKYYEEALQLSPQNAVIRNEYGRLVLSLNDDCPKAVSIFEDSIRIDPYYSETRTALTQAYSLCAESLSDAEKASILTAVEGALEKAGDDPTLWLQLGRLYQEAGQFDDAVAAYEEARGRANTAVPAWSVNYQLATLYFAQGDVAQAREWAEQALAEAPAESNGEILTFLTQLDNEAIPLSEGRLVGEGETRPLAVISPTLRQNSYTAYPEMLIDPNKRYDAVIITELGEIRLQLFADLAPLATNSFVFLATQGFYDGLTFHNVLSNYIAQGGDPTGTGRGGPGYVYNDEMSNGLVFNRAGLVALANQQPNQNGSQFFITLIAAPGLNGRYTIFGQVVSGLDVAQALTPRSADSVSADAPPGDTILRVDIYEFEK